METPAQETAGGLEQNDNEGQNPERNFDAGYIEPGMFEYGFFILTGLFYQVQGFYREQGKNAGHYV